MTSKTPRTRNQYSIHYGDYSAVICELGAKIRRFDYQGKEIFCPFGVNDLTPTCNGYVLAPWPNRIENGEYDFNGKHYCAPVNEYHPAPRNNANHGYAYHYMWKLESLTDSAVTLSLRFPNLDGYPSMPAMMATNRHRGLSACIRGWPTASRAQLPPNAMPTPPPATCRLRPPVM